MVKLWNVGCWGQKVDITTLKLVQVGTVLCWQDDSALLRGDLSTPLRKCHSFTSTPNDHKNAGNHKYMQDEWLFLWDKWIWGIDRWGWCKNEFVYNVLAMVGGEQKMWKYEKIWDDNPK